MKPPYRSFLIAEAFICFCPCVLLLAVDLFAVFLQLRMEIWGREFWVGLAITLAQFFGGLIGLVSFVLVLHQVLRQSQDIRVSLWHVAGIAIGIATAMPFLFVESWGFALFGALPIACALHVLYLARRMLVSLSRGLGCREALSSLHRRFRGRADIASRP